jgi:hypothetical protein
LKSFILPASSKNKFRIWSLYALIFGTTTGGGAAGAEPEPSDSAPELAPGENNRAAISEAADNGLTEPGGGRAGVPVTEAAADAGA